MGSDMDVNEFVSLRDLTREFGRDWDAVVAEFRAHRLGDLGVSALTAAELRVVWGSQDAERTAAEREAARQASEAADHERVFRRGADLLDALAAVETDLRFTRRQLERESGAEQLGVLERRLVAELADRGAAEAAWLEWQAAHPELAHAVRRSREERAGGEVSAEGPGFPPVGFPKPTPSDFGHVGVVVPGWQGI